MFKFLITTLFIIHYSLFIPPALAATSPDAIGVRIVPNVNHYSPVRWYQKNVKVQGAPQSMAVDGYDAVRDGRTVYVAAANVSGGTFYTNIYLISYNNNSDPETIDIFGQMLNHWRFNNNITDTGFCSAYGGASNGSTVCYRDADCGQGEFCTSQKAKITRDTRRLADVAELSIALKNYKDKNGIYPKLAAGTYVPHYTLSTWPSWNDNLSKELGTALPVDPINKLGDCGNARFNSTTCWDEKLKQFYSNSISIPPTYPTAPTYPTNSSAYAYFVSPDGASCRIYKKRESRSDYLISQGAISCQIIDQN
jgi:hypothetical protein